MNQVSVYITDDLQEKISKRLPRSLKISVAVRFLLAAAVMDLEELTDFIDENKIDRESLQFLENALLKLHATTEDDFGERGEDG